MQGLGRKYKQSLGNFKFFLKFEVIFVQFYKGFGRLHLFYSYFFTGGRPTTTLYISEVCNKNRRGRYNSFLSFFTVLGFMSTYALLYLFPVQVVAGISSMISMLGFTGTFFLPESHYHYAVRNQREKAIESVLWYVLEFEIVI